MALSLFLSFAEYTHVFLVPAVWALVCPVARVFPHGYENRLCVGVGIAESGAVNLLAAEALAWCDNFALVPLEPSAVLPLPLPLAECTHVAPVPVVLVLVCFVVCAFPHGYEDFPCAGAGLADSGAAHFPMPAQLGQDVPAAILA